jgi:hypothetical protein
VAGRGALFACPHTHLDGGGTTRCWTRVCVCVRACVFCGHSAHGRVGGGVCSCQVSFCFHLFDEDRSNSIEEGELVAILKANHMAGDPAAVQRKAQTIMRQADNDGDGCITLEEFHVIAQVGGVCVGGGGRGGSAKPCVRGGRRVWVLPLHRFHHVVASLRPGQCALPVACCRVVGGQLGADGRVCLPAYPCRVHSEIPKHHLPVVRLNGT